ncbi:Cryptochrome/DNA photolyase FAD-binding domain-like protein [Gracilaria domingensis]|nr:Cryptochrome/DNA photolyase FAD-binding domain-like protein [Gracilaria domingensis]
MANSLRTRYNFALELAIYLFEKYRKSLRVFHVIHTVAQDVQPLPARHAAFQLEKPVHDTCAAITAFAQNAVLVVADTCYLRRGRADRGVIESIDPDMNLLDLDEIDAVLENVVRLDRRAPRLRSFRGGQNETQIRLGHIFTKRLREYGSRRNEAAKQMQSDLSLFLRAGNISAMNIALCAKECARKKPSMKECLESFLEELIVCRELTVNASCFNAKAYDMYENIFPSLVKESLALYKSVKRPKIRTNVELDAALTADPY